jgi:nucleotide-binding universal stress UspA family protein
MTIPRNTVTGGDAVETTYASVLVPLDGSEHAERAIGAGWMLTRCFSAGLHVVSAGVDRTERWWYEGYLDRLDPGPGLAARHLHYDPDVPRGILATAQHLAPCLLCLATHGRSRLAAVTGSTFATVAARAKEPLVAVGPHVPAGRRSDIDRLAVCLDGRAPAESALPVAAGWARTLGACVSLLTVADPALSDSHMAWDVAAGTNRYLPDGDPQAYLDGLAGQPELAGLEVDTQVLWSTSAPHGAIGDHLDDDAATLAVATTHGRTGLARTALGSEVARIVHRSPGPVLVVPPHAGR